eukprot:scaffold236806_cov13-Tisochrysis_lutea.AAC.1
MHAFAIGMPLVIPDTGSNDGACVIAFPETAQAHWFMGGTAALGCIQNLSPTWNGSGSSLYRREGAVGIVDTPWVLDRCGCCSLC